MWVAVVLASCVNGQINCPDSSLVSPCVCGDNGDGLTASLNCFARNVNDAKVSDILDAFLAPSSRANPIGYLNLGYNPITQSSDIVERASHCRNGQHWCVNHQEQCFQFPPWSQFDRFPPLFDQQNRKRSFPRFVPINSLQNLLHFIK